MAWCAGGWDYAKERVGVQSLAPVVASLTLSWAGRMGTPRYCCMGCPSGFVGGATMVSQNFSAGGIHWHVVPPSRFALVWHWDPLGI